MDPDKPDDYLCSGGERFVLAEFRGDQEFHRLIWQHAASWQSTQVCMQCCACAKAGHLAYTVMSEHPGWSPTEHTSVDFINKELPPFPCALVRYN